MLADQTLMLRKRDRHRVFRDTSFNSWCSSFSRRSCWKLSSILSCILRNSSKQLRMLLSKSRMSINSNVRILVYKLFWDTWFARPSATVSSSLAACSKCADTRSRMLHVGSAMLVELCRPICSLFLSASERILMLRVCAESILPVHNTVLLGTGRSWCSQPSCSWLSRMRSSISPNIERGFWHSEKFSRRGRAG